MNKPTMSLEDIRRALQKQDEELEAAFADLDRRALTVDPEALRRLAELAESRSSAPQARCNVTHEGVRC
jgi:hypothetical protein